MQKLLDELKILLERASDPLSVEWDPIRALAIIAVLENPELEVDELVRRSSELFDSVREKAQAAWSTTSLRDRTQVLLNLFHGELGFEGDKHTYYNLKNSLLNDMLSRRKGIPISLSVMFIGFCRQMGVRAVGVGFPGHFLVKVLPDVSKVEEFLRKEDVHQWREQWFVDVFDGSFLTVDECERRLKEWTRGVVPFGPETLAISRPREMVSRLLRNLRALCMEKEDLTRLFWILSALVEVCPQDRVEALRERGLLFARMGRYPLAVADFHSYLLESPDAEKKSHVERLLRHFESVQDLTN
jgi:regulator of sirC expression with transglutaminase-like and TPR domain